MVPSPYLIWPSTISLSSSVTFTLDASLHSNLPAGLPTHQTHSTLTWGLCIYGFLFTNALPRYYSLTLFRPLLKAIGSKTFSDYINWLYKLEDSFFLAPSPPKYALFFSVPLIYLFIVCLSQLKCKFYEVRGMFAHFVHCYYSHCLACFSVCIRFSLNICWPK